MRVTLDSKDTKNRIVSAAMTANLWGFKNKNEAFLRDIPPEKRSQTDERKHPPEKRSQTDDRKRSTKRKRSSSSQKDKNAPKKAKKARDRLIEREILRPPKRKKKGQEKPDTARTRSTHKWMKQRWLKLRRRNQHAQNNRNL